MSVETNENAETDAAFENCPDVEFVIRPRTRDLGGFTVGRILPHAKRRMVGPFIFYDVMGPAEFKPGAGIDVRPHPHIGLATVTYLFDGEIRHKDNLGFDQVIRPGDVNWMTAGSGIVHSERTDETLRARSHRLHGIQSWVALPEKDAEVAASFHHHPKDSLPAFKRNGAAMRLIAGNAFGAESPVTTYSDIFYLSVDAAVGAEISLPDDHEERALHLVSGALSVNGTRIEPGRMLVFKPRARPHIIAEADSMLMLLGGAPVGPRIIWWNLVASSQERIERAKKDWILAASNGFADAPFTLPPDEAEFIPLPVD